MTLRFEALWEKGCASQDHQNQLEKPSDDRGRSMRASLEFLISAFRWWFVEKTVSERR